MNQDATPLESSVLLPHYVYVLLDDERKPFYVGKGQGNRAFYHTGEVKRFLSKEVLPLQTEERASVSLSNKQSRIRDLLSSGNEPEVMIVGRFETAEEAFSVETVLINFVYGYDELLNKSRGRRANMVRPKGEYGELPDIDIRRTRGERTGEFSSKKMERLQLEGAYDFLSEFLATVEKREFEVRGFEGRDDRRFAPGESNGKLGFLVRIHGIDFVVSFSHTKRPSISIANTLVTRQSLPKGRCVLEKEYKIGEPKNLKVEGQGRYIELIDQSGMCLRFDDDKEALDKLERIRRLFSDSSPNQALEGGSSKH